MRYEAAHEQWLDAIISLDEAAKLRGIDVKTLRSEIRRGALKDIKVSKKRRGMTRREAFARLKMLIRRPRGSAPRSTPGYRAQRAVGGGRTMPHL
jgi:hypothetical protein